MTSLPWDELREAAGDDGISRVPDGWYDCVIKSTKTGKTSNDYQKVNARFVVLNGPYEGSSVFKDFVVTIDKPGGLKFFFRHMAVLGITKDQFNSDLTMEALADKLVGRSAQVQVGTRMWNDQERMEVKDLKPLAGGGFAFGGDTILAGASPTPMPAPIAPDPLPMPMPVPEPEVFAPAMAGSELPPEPPF